MESVFPLTAPPMTSATALKFRIPVLFLFLDRIVEVVVRVLIDTCGDVGSPT